MRVALVSRRFAYEGSLERDALFLAVGLSAAGVDVHAYGDTGRCAPDLDCAVLHDVAPLVRGNSRLGEPVERATFALRATRALRSDREAYDLVHVFDMDGWEHDVVNVHEVVAAAQRRWPDEGGQDYAAARLRASLAPALRPQIAVGRGVQSLQFRRGRFRRAIAVTEAVRADLSSTHGVPADLVDVIPPPVDVRTFRRPAAPAVRRELGLTAGEQLVLFVGHAFERKGLADAVAALPALPSRLHLVVVGGGDPAPFLRQADRLQVRSRIHFAGATGEPHRWYAAADLLVLPTRHDPWGIPLIEAMAAGVPAVASRVAGAASAVIDAGAGLVVPERDLRSLSDAIRVLAADPGRRREMSARGRRAAEAFGIEAHARKALRTYEVAMTQKSAGEKPSAGLVEPTCVKERAQLAP